MFTGIIEEVGAIAGIGSRGRGCRLTVRFSGWQDLEPGESVSVDGVCLTVARAGAGEADFDAVPETVGRTRLASYRVGRRVNLERSLRPADRLGGHFVSGHVDGIGRVHAIRESETEYRVEIAVGEPGGRLLVPKGSVAVDGVSLTVAELARDSFTVAIVPYTWEHTTLADRRTGDDVHLEFDMLGKYVYRALSRYLEPQKGLEALLREGGYLQP